MASALGRTTIPAATGPLPDPGTAPPWLRPTAGGTPPGMETAAASNPQYAPQQSNGYDFNDQANQLREMYGFSPPGSSSTPVTSAPLSLGSGGLPDTGYKTPPAQFLPGGSMYVPPSADTLRAMGMPATDARPIPSSAIPSTMAPFMPQHSAELTTGGTNALGRPTPGAPQAPAGNASGYAGLDLSGLPEPDMDYTGASERARNASWESTMALLNPEFETQRRATEQRLANQGLPTGSEAATGEMDRVDRTQGAQRQIAANQAVLAGNTEAGNVFQRALAARAQKAGERVSGAGLGLGARGQDIGAATSKYGTDTASQLALRRLGLDENSQEFQQLLAMIASARGGVNMPNFGTPAPLDVTGANSISSANRNNQLAREASDRAGLYQLGGAALGAIPWSQILGP